MLGELAFENISVISTVHICYVSWIVDIPIRLLELKLDAITYSEL